MEDVQLECVDCGASFTCSVGEQEFYFDKGFRDHRGRVRLPIRCQDCRAIKKQRRQEIERAAMRA